MTSRIGSGPRSGGAHHARGVTRLRVHETTGPAHRQVVSTEIVRYRYRAYPTGKQVRLFARLFGATRVAYNDAVAYCRAEHAAGRGFPTDVQTIVLTHAKKTPQRAWFNEVYGVCLVQAVGDARTAYRNFFDSLTGKRRGRKVSAPVFKSRHHNRHTARFSTAARFSVTIDGRTGTLHLPKMYGPLRFTASRDLPSTPTSVTLVQEPDGRYYVSFVVQRPTRTTGPRGAVAGIDVGLSSYAHVLTRTTQPGDLTATETVVETVTTIATPAYLRRKERALRRSQRALSRTTKGSRNRAKARVRVARLHRKVREARLDHAHQHAARLVAAHDMIAVETLHTAPMARNRRTAKAVHDQAMSQFLRVLEHKAASQGTPLVKVARTYPSTQTCSTCTHITGPRGLTGLSVRRWTCTHCGTHHDRDINAATNILNEGLRLLTHNPESPMDSRRHKTLAEVRQTPSPAQSPTKQEEPQEIRSHATPT